MKKLLAAFMALVMSVSVIPASTMMVTAAEVDGDEASYDDDDDEADPTAGELTVEDIIVKPAKKTIKVGNSFSIYIAAVLGSDYEDLPDEEWEELIENNVDNITYRSSKSSVASVNKRTGKVKGLKKGSAVIKTTIDLANGQSITFKTKVYVTK